MGWEIGWDSNWKRDIGYGVPALCDNPSCNEKIDRGLSHRCDCCDLHFCCKHLYKIAPENQQKPVSVCSQCAKGEKPYSPKPDLPEWINHKLTHESWEQWRQENPDIVVKLMNPDNNLLPCPFCGAEPTLYEIPPHTHSPWLIEAIPQLPDHPGSWVVECGCGCGLIDTKREDVVKHWNTRHQSQC